MFFSFLLKRHITYQAARQVFAFFRCPQSTEKNIQIVFHILLIIILQLSITENYFSFVI